MVEFMPLKMSKKIPTRMCIVCRSRFEQSGLIRLQYINSQLHTYTKSGRSFYVCSKCLAEKSLQKKISQTLKISYDKALELCQYIKEIGVK